ncbi:hypothetical protein [Nocardia suismassiliense]|uniref:hypothetical protein n=1 Tax=Nocardia suismassiliense TaxID=2077092 RepID=UPI00131F3819|nr:hypothetical protein [Nocardia suismassiliense]
MPRDVSTDETGRRLPPSSSDLGYKTNVLAAVAWVLGFIGAFFLAIPLAIIALTRTPKIQQNNRDLAIGALISGFGIPLAIVLFNIVG